MASVINDRDVLLQAASPRLLDVRMPTTFNIAGDVNGTLNDIPVTTVLSDLLYATSGDATIDILENSGTVVVMTASNLFKTGTGLNGVFIGAGGLFGKDGSGVTTFSIDAATGDVFNSGDLITTGDVKADGVNVTTITLPIAGSTFNIDYSIFGDGTTDASTSSNVRAGILGRAIATISKYNVGVVGIGTDIAKGIGVAGDGDFIGVYGTNDNTNLPGIHANNTNSGGLALNVDGRMQIVNSLAVGAGSTTTTQDLTNKPGTSTAANTWYEMSIDGTTYVFPIWVKT